MKINSTLFDLLFLFMIFIAFFSRCTISKSSINDSSQEGIYRNSLSKLKRGKSMEKNKLLLVSSIDSLLIEKSLIKQNYIEKGGLANLEKGYEVNSFLQGILVESGEFTEGKYLSELTSLNNENAKLKQVLKDSFYIEGIRLLDEAKVKIDRKISREAYSYLKKSKKYGKVNMNGAIQESLEFSTVLYLVRTKDSDGTNDHLIDTQFKKIENVKAPFTAVKYDTGKKIPCDCLVDVRFSRLMFMLLF